MWLFIHSVIKVKQCLYEGPLLENKNPYIQHDQQHDYWWRGDTPSQSIVCYGIDLFIPGCSGLGHKC